MWGSNFHGGLGYARDWKQNLLNKGYSADSIPQVGDIAWWSHLSGSSCMHLGRPCGHVAFVNKVSPNGTIEITEYNGRNRLSYSTRVIEKNGNSTYPHAFIHVQSKK